MACFLKSCQQQQQQYIFHWSTNRIRVSKGTLWCYYVLLLLLLPTVTIAFHQRRPIQIPQNVPFTRTSHGHPISISISIPSPAVLPLLHHHNQTPYTSSSRSLITSGRLGPSWDGDDVRWLQKIKRRLYRSNLAGGYGVTPARSTLVVMIALMFLYQTIDTIHLIRRQNPSYWPNSALSIISDTVLGTTDVRGPLTMSFMHNEILSQRQPHRFLTSGFLHGDILHLLLNIDALRRLPSWLETGLGKPLFVTTFLVSIVTGNMGHSFNAVNSSYAGSTFCLGASGGICGLYGLMYVALTKMGQTSSAQRVLKGMALLLASGFLWDNVSNAAHLGGFFGGMVMGILCSPSYRKNYLARRKWSLEVDLWPRDYRQMMGFGISPNKSLVPVQALWAVAACAMVLEPTFRSIPSSILASLLRPGSLS